MVDADADRLVSTILEGQIIPGLLRNHSTGVTTGFDPQTLLASVERDAAMLTEALLGWRSDQPSALVNQLRNRGVDGARLAEMVLGESARRLGNVWSEDRCSFFQVSLGMSELQSLLRSLRREPSFVQPRKGTGKLVLATAPGEQHNFGISVLEAAFAEAGWTTVIMTGQPFSALRELVAQERFDLVALSCSCSGLLDGLKSGIRTIRKASLNGGLKVLVGGHLQSQEVCLAERVGADASAVDIDTALAVAERLVTETREFVPQPAR